MALTNQPVNGYRATGTYYVRVTDADDARPLSERIASDLRERISSGDLQPGSKLPSEQDLAEAEGVSRDTVRRALTVLTQEGLITAGRGRGRTVRSHDRLRWHPGMFERTSERRDTPGSGQDAWQADVAAQGYRPRQEVEVMIVPAPSLVAERLGLDAGTPVVTRRRVRYVNGEPNQTADSFYPMDVAQGTAIMQPGDVVIPGGLMASAGHRQVRFVDEITARLANADERKRLNLPPVTAISEHVRTGYNTDGRPVRVIVTVGERMTIVYISDEQ